MTILIDRHHTVVVWRNNNETRYNCGFCSIKDAITEKTGIRYDINGTCPINIDSCICRCGEEDISFHFNNTRDTILATIYKCNMKGTICHRDCNRCTVNKLINLIKKQTS